MLSVAYLLLGAAGPAAAHAEFGIASFDGSVRNQDGSPATQAGGHPFSASISFMLNTNPDGSPEGGLVKDVIVELPPGLVADLGATPQCSQSDFDQGTCASNTQIGETTLYITNSSLNPRPVFNLVPPTNAPAQFGVLLPPAERLTVAVRPGDFGFNISLTNIDETLPLVGLDMTFFGQGGAETFLTNPTSCSGPLTTTLSVDSWANPGVFVDKSFASHDSSGNPVELSGCERLNFNPSISLQPDTTVADSPAGLSLDIHTPQNDSSGLAESQLKNAEVTLPAGTSVSMSTMEGLQACSPAQIGVSDANEPTCPEASKIGSVELDTPLLPDPLEGSVYLAQQSANPFGTLLAVYIVAEGHGVLVKLPGRVNADPSTGQLMATFDNMPQLPFSDIKLDFFGGPRAIFLTPDSCGPFTTTSDLTPWSSPELADATPSDSFQINSGCVSGFAPSFSAGMIDNLAGGFSSFSVTVSRSDQDQDLGGFTVRTPPGLLAKIKGAPLCGEPQAAQGACSPASQIGHVTVAAGAGSDPLLLPQAGMPQDPVYLTGPYKGAPFGLSVVVPAEAGPFNLGTVVVRAAINIEPHTAQITITSDPLPTILAGIPLKFRTIKLTLDRERFMFNPTSCDPMAVDGTITSSAGAPVEVSSRFQAAACANLPFKPKFTASTLGKASFSGNGASLVVRVASQSGPGLKPGQEEANIRKLDVQLPKALPTRLTTLQGACTEAQFASDPAGCPAGSDVGTAVANTPMLPVPMAGPVYLVSHGGAAFPDLAVVLQGDGVTIDLIGNALIKNGITYSRFDTFPDAPISSFEMKLPEGRHSALAANRNLCARTKTVTVTRRVSRHVHGQVVHVLEKVKQRVAEALDMPTTITGQNGAVVEQTTKVDVSGCTTQAKRSNGREDYAARYS